MKKIGEVEIKLTRLERGTTKPLLQNIEIIYPNGYKTQKRYTGIIDTGADITMIDSTLLRTLNLESLDNGLFRLKMKVFELFKDEILVFEVQPWDISHNNKFDTKPDILLGRDFLTRCTMNYNGLNNLVNIESYKID